MQFSVLRKSAATENWELRTGFRYHFFVHELADRLLQTIRKQKSIRAGDRVAVAVSGGADSVALLCLLLELRAELGIVLSVAHVNHKLRGEESDEDERFVAKLARQHGLELHTGEAPIDRRHISQIGSEIGFGSRSGISGIEAAARKLRYGFFRQLARDGRASKIVTAHTLDDQAETVLLRIFRGTGIRGLSGVHPRIVFQRKDARSASWYGRCSAFGALPCRNFCASRARAGGRIRRIGISPSCAIACGIGCCP